MARTAVSVLFDGHPPGPSLGGPILPLNWLVGDNGRAGKDLEVAAREWKHRSTCMVWWRVA